MHDKSRKSHRLDVVVACTASLDGFEGVSDRSLEDSTRGNVVDTSASVDHERSKGSNPARTTWEH